MTRAEHNDIMSMKVVSIRLFLRIALLKPPSYSLSMLSFVSQRDKLQMGRR